MRRGLLAAAAAQVENFLLEPAEVVGDGPLEPRAVAPPWRRPVIAVHGLARGCGATFVARALAAELAARDPAGAAAVASAKGAGGIPIATPAATRLAGALADVPRATTTAVGRLCLVVGAGRAALAATARGLAPLVIDAGVAEVEGEPALVADRVLLVGAPGVEPALAAAAAACVGRLAKEAVIVSNRAAVNEQPLERTSIALPESRLGAQLALGGRQARGELGRAVAGLADLCEVGA